MKYPYVTRTQIFMEINSYFYDISFQFPHIINFLIKEFVFYKEIYLFLIKKACTSNKNLVFFKQSANNRGKNPRISNFGYKNKTANSQNREYQTR